MDPAGYEPFGNRAARLITGISTTIRPFRKSEVWAKALLFSKKELGFFSKESFHLRPQGSRSKINSSGVAAMSSLGESMKNKISSAVLAAAIPFFAMNSAHAYWDPVREEFVTELAGLAGNCSQGSECWGEEYVCTRWEEVSNEPDGRDHFYGNAYCDDDEVKIEISIRVLKNRDLTPGRIELSFSSDDGFPMNWQSDETPSLIIELTIDGYVAGPDGGITRKAILNWLNRENIVNESWEFLANNKEKSPPPAPSARCPVTDPEGRPILDPATGLQLEGEGQCS